VTQLPSDRVFRPADKNQACRYSENVSSPQLPQTTLEMELLQVISCMMFPYTSKFQNFLTPNVPKRHRRNEEQQVDHVFIHFFTVDEIKLGNSMETKMNQVEMCRKR